MTVRTLPLTIAIVMVLMSAARVMATSNRIASGDIQATWLTCRDAGADAKARIGACSRLLEDPALRQNSNRTFVFSNRGNSFVSLHRYDEALADFEQALKLSPTNDNALVGRGNVHFWKGESEAALQDYMKAVSLDPKPADRYNDLGNVYFTRGQYDDAIKAYGEALRRDPKYFFAYSGRGNVYRETKAYDRAVTDYTSAIQLNPSYANAYINRGAAYLAQQRSNEAISDLSKAVLLDPDSIEGYVNRGDAYGVAKDWQHAIADFTQALQRDPTRLDARFGRGQAYKEAGQLDLAAADYRNILSQRPDYLNTRDLLAELEKAGALAAAPEVPGRPAPPTALGAAIETQHRVALVIGNAAYPQAPLANPHNDAADVTAKLKNLGFDVVTGYDLTLAGFSDTIDRFVQKARGADVAVFYYSGHAMQIDGENWLLPTDTRVGSVFDVQQFNVSLQRLLQTVDSQAKVTLVFLDGCRNNPLADTLMASLKAQSRALRLDRGLARITVDSPDTLVVFATQPNDVAADGSGRNSPFTKAFLDNVATPGVEVETLMKRVTAEVKANTGDHQRPERLSGLTTEFYFVPTR